jgi:hypothetical protein
MHIAVASDVCAKNLDNVCMDDSLITVWYFFLIDFPSYSASLQMLFFCLGAGTCTRSLSRDYNLFKNIENVWKNVGKGMTLLKLK